MFSDAEDMLVNTDPDIDSGEAPNRKTPLEDVAANSQVISPPDCEWITLL